MWKERERGRGVRTQKKPTEKSRETIKTWKNNKKITKRKKKRRLKTEMLKINKQVYQKNGRPKSQDTYWFPKCPLPAPRLRIRDQWL